MYNAVKIDKKCEESNETTGNSSGTFPFNSNWSE